MRGEKLSPDDDFPDWFKRKRMPFKEWGFDDIDEMLHEMERMMEEEFREFTKEVPKDFVHERKLPDGSTAREFGPFVYGYSFKIGSDGKPEVREFGNMKPTRRGTPQIKEEREPLVDIVETDGEIHVVVEMPGVEKEDISVHGTEDSLTISVDTPQRKYYKNVTLPTKVKVNEATSTYKNGVLEIKLPKVKGEKKPPGSQIRIE